MSNLIYDNEFYNKEVKEAYMEQTKRRVPSVIRIFKVAASMERSYQKDLYDFNRDELKGLFYLLAPTKFNSSYQNAVHVSSYIDWAIEQGYRQKINPLLAVERDYYRQFVIKAKQYFTEQELEDMISQCKNPQDAVIIRLRMEGVGGEGNSEILNLKISDVDQENNVLRLVNDNGEERFLKVSDKCISLCVAAHNQKTYLKRNGAYKKNIKAPTTKLVENDYILKTSITKVDNYQRADKFLIHRRLSMLSEYFNQPYLTSTNIGYSGMLMYMKHIYLEKGGLNVSDYNAIFNRFGLKEIEKGGAAVFYNFRDEFFNIDTMKELYNL